ncbi:AraC family transcriptional regulator [Lewinellaceae bacterium SD302]|nr:AraC family transcriptional regulator [Lewinellaceae bacterium SD302]
MLALDINGLRARPLHTLVENRTTFTLDTMAINLFETHERAEAVKLKFDNPVLASMIVGRKVMHLKEDPGFNFLPGESVMLPRNELMTIDFPDAKAEAPTKCLALEINPEEIDKVVRSMNENRPRSDGQEWTYCNRNFHLANDTAINQLLQRLVFLSAENHPAKEIFVNMSLSELLIRLLEIESRDDHVRDLSRRASSHPITATVTYILNNLSEKLTVDKLSKLACMSSSAFYRDFKNEIGVSPVEFITEQRIKQSISFLKKGQLSVKDIALRCGFSSASYFTRVFSSRLGVNPTQYNAK